MGHTVADVAAVLSAMAYFRDPRDPVTALIPEQYKFGTDFTKNLDANFLAGKRIGWLTGNTKRPDADPKWVLHARACTGRLCLLLRRRHRGTASMPQPAQAAMLLSMVHVSSVMISRSVAEHCSHMHHHV